MDLGANVETGLGGQFGN